MVMKRDKKAWLRIVEATISLMIIFGSILLFYQINKSVSSDDLSSVLPVLADQIAKNETLRAEIIFLNASNSSEVKNAEQDINEFATIQLDRTDYGLASNICTIDDSCSLPNMIPQTNSSIFSYERIISTDVNISNFDSQNTPKKLRLYLWKNQ